MKIGIVLSLLSFNLYAGFLPASFKADFKQSYVSSLSKKARVTEGKISYKYPSHLFFKVEGDEPVTYVSNPEKSWVYNPPFIEGEKGTVRESTATRHAFSKFFDALSKGLVDNKLYKVKIEAKKATLTFSEEVSKQISIASADLFFKKEANSKTEMTDLDKIELNYTVKKPKVTLTFNNYEEGVKFNSDFFIFNPPKNTDIIRD